MAETGHRMGMSYQWVWTLVRAMNTDFVQSLINPQHGGTASGGAQLTPLASMWSAQDFADKTQGTST
jgi:molybdate transport repressor ModE-like protein